MSGLRQMLAAYMGADRYMRQAVSKINSQPKSRRVVAHVVLPHAPALAEAHPSINKWVAEADVRIKIFTHADLLSDAALNIAVRAAEEKDPDVAIVAINTKNSHQIKAKKFAQIRSLFLGGMKGCDAKRILVCGHPNAGKSSVIVPLTKSAVLETKKKRHTHVAKISPLAGRTAGVKEHRLSPKDPIFLTDTPGLLPTELTEKQIIEAVVSGSLPESAGVVPKTWDIELVIGCLLDGLNFHAEVSGGVPEYVKALRLPGPTTDASLFLTHFMKSDLNSIKEKHKMHLPMLAYNIVGLIRKGSLGKLLILSTEEKEAALRPSAAGIKCSRGEGSPIVYLNPRAESIITTYESSIIAQKEEKKAKKVAKHAAKASNTTPNSDA